MIHGECCDRNRCDLETWHGLVQIIPNFPYPFFLPLQEFVAGDRSEELILKLDNRHLLGSSDHTKVYRAVHHSLAEYIQALA